MCECIFESCGGLVGLAWMGWQSERRTGTAETEESREDLLDREAGVRRSAAPAPVTIAGARYIDEDQALSLRSRSRAELENSARENRGKEGAAAGLEREEWRIRSSSGRDYVCQ
jgi:hypothetical protein